jgi:DNA-binding NarL/FixJ family response regulator
MAIAVGWSARFGYLLIDLSNPWRVTIERQEVPVVSERNGARTKATRILVCDDTKDIRLLLHTEFEMHDDLEIVAEAENGREAIQLAESTHPDVIVLDLAMPEMDGLEALPEIRKVSPDSAVIVLSSYDAGSIQTQAIALGARRFVDKGSLPWEIADVVKEVSRG